VVFDAAGFEALGVVDGGFVADVYDGLDAAAPLRDEFVRGVCGVDLAEGFHAAEDSGDGGADGGDGLPFLEVFDVPFSFCGEVLELVGEGEAGVDVGVKEGVDEAGEGAGGGGVVEESVRGGGGEDAGFQGTVAEGVLRVRGG